MENASKALIIAGAILISILIIGLSVYIYNNASSTIKKASLGSQEAQAQNQQFEAYFGPKVSAAEVKQLMSLVRSNNINSSNTEDSRNILAIMGESKGPQSISTAVKAGKTYNVGVANDTFNKENEDPTKDGAKDTTSAYYSSGFLRVITISENK